MTPLSECMAQLLLMSGKPASATKSTTPHTKSDVSPSNFRPLDLRTIECAQSALESKVLY